MRPRAVGRLFREDGVVALEVFRAFVGHAAAPALGEQVGRQGGEAGGVEYGSGVGVAFEGGGPAGFVVALVQEQGAVAGGAGHQRDALAGLQAAAGFEQHGPAAVVVGQQQAAHACRRWRRGAGEPGPQHAGVVFDHEVARGEQAQLRQVADVGVFDRAAAPADHEPGAVARLGGHGGDLVVGQVEVEGVGLHGRGGRRRSYRGTGWGRTVAPSAYRRQRCKAVAMEGEGVRVNSPVAIRFSGALSAFNLPFGSFFSAAEDRVGSWVAR